MTETAICLICGEQVRLGSWAFSGAPRNQAVYHDGWHHKVCLDAYLKPEEARLEERARIVGIINEVADNNPLCRSTCEVLLKQLDAWDEGRWKHA